jgi:hypothetical protein
MAVESARADDDGSTVLTLRHASVELKPDGAVVAETRAVYGEECVPFRDAFERTLEAQVLDWHYTDDYSTSPATVREARRIDLG